MYSLVNYILPTVIESGESTLKLGNIEVPLPNNDIGK